MRRRDYVVGMMVFSLVFGVGIWWQQTTFAQSAGTELESPKNFLGKESVLQDGKFGALLNWDTGNCDYTVEVDGEDVCASTDSYTVTREPPFPDGKKVVIENGSGLVADSSLVSNPINTGGHHTDLTVEPKDEETGHDGVYTYSLIAWKFGIDNRLHESEPVTATVTIDPEKPEECPDFNLYGAQDGDQLHFWWPKVCDAMQYKVEWSQDIYEYQSGLPWAVVARQEQGELIIDDPTTTETTLVVTAGAPYSSVKVTAQFRTAEGEVVDLGSDRLSFQLRRFAPVTRVEHGTTSVTVLSGSDGEPIGAEMKTTSQGYRDPTACRPPSDLTFESLYPNVREAFWVRTQEEPSPFNYYSSRSAGPGVVGWTDDRMTGSLVRLDYRYPADVFVPNPRPSAPAFPEQPKAPVYPPAPSPKYRDRPDDVSEHIWFIMTARGETLTDAWRAWNSGVVEQATRYLQTVQDYLVEVDVIGRQHRRALVGWEIDDKQRWVDHTNHLYGDGKVPNSAVELERTSLIGPLAIINQCHNVLGSIEVKELELNISSPRRVEVVGGWQIHEVTVTAEKIRYTQEREPADELELAVTFTEGYSRHSTDLEALRTAIRDDTTFDSPTSYTTDLDGKLTFYLQTPTSQDAAIKLTHEVKQPIEYQFDNERRTTQPTPVILVGRLVAVPARPQPIALTATTDSGPADSSRPAGDTLSPATQTVSLTIRSADLNGRPDLRGGTAAIEVMSNFDGPVPTLTTMGGQTLTLPDGRGELALSPLSFTTVNFTLPDDVFNRTGVAQSAYTVTVSRTMENGQTFTSEEVVPVATKDLPAPKLTLSLPDVSIEASTPPTLGAGTTVPITLRAFRPLQKSDGSVVEEPVAGVPVSLTVSGYRLRKPDDLSIETTAWHSQSEEDKDQVSIEGPSGEVWEFGDVTSELLGALDESVTTDENGELVLTLSLPTSLPPTTEPPVYTLRATIKDNSTGVEKETTAELSVGVALRTMQVTTEVEQTIPGQSGDILVTVTELGVDGQAGEAVANATVAIALTIPEARHALVGGAGVGTEAATVAGSTEGSRTAGAAPVRQLSFTTDADGRLRIPVSQLQTLRFPDLPLAVSIAVSKPGFASTTLTGDKVASAQLATRTQPIYHARVTGDLTSEFAIHHTLTTAYGDPIDWYFDQVMETKETGEDAMTEELYKTFAWLKPGVTYDPTAAFDENLYISNNPIVIDSSSLGRLRFQRLESVAQSVDLVSLIRLPFLLGYGEFLQHRLSLELPGADELSPDPTPGAGESTEEPPTEPTTEPSEEPITGEVTAEPAPEP